MKAYKALSNGWQNVRQTVKNMVAYIDGKNASGNYLYGQFDDLPNRIVEDLNNSGTATLALRRLHQFIEADGFIEDYTYNRKANSQQTWGELLNPIIENKTKTGGFALRLFFSTNNKIASVKCVPITWIRRRSSGFVVNPLMGEVGRNSSLDEYIPEFDPTPDPKQRMKRINEEIKKHGYQVGELYYCFEPKLGRNYHVYPVPDFYSGIEDIQSDAKISTLELTNIAQGWRAQVVIATKKYDNLNEDEHGMTERDHFHETIDDFVGEDAARVMHLEANNADEMPQVTILDNKEIVDMTEKSTIRVGEKVCRLIGVPPILCGFNKAGQLGNVQELKNTIELFNMTITGIQNFITSKLNYLKPYMEGGDQLNFELTKLNPFNFLPDFVMQKLSDEELRDMFGLEQTITDNDEEIASRFSEFGVGGVQGILGIQTAVSDGTISLSAGVTVLKVIYGFTDENSIKMLGGSGNTIDESVIIEEQSKQPQTNDTLTNLTGRQMQNVQRIVRKFNKGELTFEQAGVMLKDGFGFTDDQVNVWLVTNEEEDGTIEN
jgi:hypothetical protein